MAAEQHVDNNEEENCEKPAKHKYQANILDNFNKLTSGHEQIRIKSGVQLLKHLAETTNSEKDNEIKYALSRLIRGLGASKIQTRTGYFTCLVGLLSVHGDVIQIDEIFDVLQKELHKGGGNSKSENADVSAGRILVAGAILRTNLYENATAEEKKRIFELLIDSGKERTYLNLAAYSFLVDLYNKISAEEFNKTIFPLIKTELSLPLAQHNLDTLYLLLKTSEKFPKTINGKFLTKTLGNSSILCEENFSELCQLLTTLPRIAALNHPVFPLLITKLSQSAPNLITQFAFNLDLTLQRSNRNKYFVLIKFLNGLIENLQDPSILPSLLPSNFIQQTIQTFKNAVGKNRDKQFEENINKLFENLLETLKNNATLTDETRLQVLQRLIFYPGTFIFEKVTRTRLIQNITQTLKAEGVKNLAKIYQSVILAENDRQINENQYEKWWNTDRVYASHLLTKLLNHPQMQNENQWKITQLNFLMNLGLMSNDEIGSELADSFRETFYSSLNLKLSKLEDLKQILSGLFQELNSHKLQDELRTPLSDETMETWAKTNKFLAKSGKKQEKNNQQVVFDILFLHLGLQLFNTNAKLANESLEELFSCHQRINKQKSGDEDNILWIEVMIDLFLNLLSHNSHLLRNVINCVFPHLCPFVNLNAMHQILEVLDPKSETNPLSKYGEESDDDSEESDEEESEENSEEESENDSEEDDEEGETVNDKLRMALQQALVKNGENDTSDIDLDDMDADAGEKLDEALSEAFKKFKPNLGRKKKQTKDDQILTHFRVRVLDLIECYLNTSPTMELTLEIMLPLLQILEFSIRDEHQKPLEDRVRHCLKKLTLLKKFEASETVVANENLVELLKSLLEKGTKNAIIINDMGEKISDCCIFLINCWEMSEQKKKKQNSIWRVIESNLETFFLKRDSLVPYVLFKNVVQLNYIGIVKLYETLKGFIFTDLIRPFRRYQAIELLKLFYSNHRLINSNFEAVKKQISKDQKEFLLDCVGFFKTFDPTEKKIKAKFLTNLFELLCAIKTSKLADEWTEGWIEIGEGVRECRSSLTFSNDTKVAFRKLCKSLHISNVVKMKAQTVKLNDAPENDEVEEQEESEKTNENGKKKKKKLNKDKLKLKKETKQLRLESLSEGMRAKRKLIMSYIDAAENNEEIEEEGEATPPKAKKSKTKKKLST